VYKTLQESCFFLLSDNTDAFVARNALITAAESDLDVQYYMINNDASGQYLTYALLEAADRGVQVRILVDDINLAGRDNALKTISHHDNIQIRVFNPLINRQWLRNLELLLNLDRAGRRMHNKLFIADNKTAILGGRNIGDEYFDARKSLNFIDLDVLINGDICRDLSNSFDDYWQSNWATPIEQLSKLKVVKSRFTGARKRLRDYWRRIKNTDYFVSVHRSEFSKLIITNQLRYSCATARLYYDKPEKIITTHNNIVHFGDEIMPLFDSVNEQLLISTPYFVPGETGCKWLINKARQGIDIEILTNALSTTDVTAVHVGYKKYRQRLLQAGIKIYELKRDAISKTSRSERIVHHRPNASLHAKYIVMDGQKVIIGSANIDPRSSNLNTELAVLVESDALAEDVTDVFRRTCRLDNSFHLDIDYGRVRWSTKRNGRIKQFHTEPDAPLWKRLLVFLFGLLPIENQL
jgi:putative cardiolipin synthase